MMILILALQILIKIKKKPKKNDFDFAFGARDKKDPFDLPSRLGNKKKRNPKQEEHNDLLKFKNNNQGNNGMDLLDFDLPQQNRKIPAKQANDDYDFL